MGCEHCGGHCAGCGSSMELTEGELHILRLLGQFSFLPVARKREDMTPYYREDAVYDEALYSRILQHLEVKKLICIDYDAPLSGADMGSYSDLPVHGSMALTARGYGVLELLELQGIL
jgi:hypothetical protein